MWHEGGRRRWRTRGAVSGRRALRRLPCGWSVPTMCLCTAARAVSSSPASSAARMRSRSTLPVVESGVGQLRDSRGVDEEARQVLAGPTARACGRAAMRHGRCVPRPRPSQTPPHRPRPVPGAPGVVDSRGKECRELGPCAPCRTRRRRGQRPRSGGGTAFDDARFAVDFDPQLVLLSGPDHYNGIFANMMLPFGLGP